MSLSFALSLPLTLSLSLYLSISLSLSLSLSLCRALSLTNLMVRWEMDHPGGNLGIRGDRPPWPNAAAYLRVPARKRERERAR